MDLEKLKALIGMFEESTLSELEVEQEGQRVLLRKAPETSETLPSVSLLPAPSPSVMPQMYEQRYAQGPRESSAAPAQESGASQDDEPDDEAGLVTIDSPMVGVFYAAPAPNEPNFVDADDVVAADQTVCIIEAMKLMNEVTAQFPSKIVKRLVENAEPVEFGQPLFAVRPLEQD